MIITSLADDDALEAVATDVIDSARPSSVLIDVSTVSPGVSARVASLAEAAAVEYLRAPVSGNPSVVRAGNLTFIVSGAPETLERESIGGGTDLGSPWHVIVLNDNHNTFEGVAAAPRGHPEADLEAARDGAPGGGRGVGRAGRHQITAG